MIARPRLARLLGVHNPINRQIPHRTGRIHFVVQLQFGLQFPASLSLLLHRFPFHATHQTLLVAAVLASIALPLVDYAVLFLATCIREVLTHGSLKEAFAALATEIPKTIKIVLKNY